VPENAAFAKQEFSLTLVLMEYFGYPRCEPDTSGFCYWPSKLKQFCSGFRKAEKV
jgi:hypothetical protein